jgi:hypothetical protein
MSKKKTRNNGTVELRSTWDSEIVAEWQATCDYASKEVD